MKSYVPKIAGKGFAPLESPGFQRRDVKARKILTGFTLTEMLVVIIIIGVALGISIIKVNSYFAGMRLKNATQGFIQDLQWAEERAKMGTQTFVMFGTQGAAPGTYTGTYTVLMEGVVIENPIWLSNTEKKRDMRDFHLMPNIPIDIGSFAFATITGFVETVETPVVISLTLKGRSKYVTVSSLGKVSERK